MPAGFTDTNGALAYLDEIGRGDDAAMDVFEAALALSAPCHPGISLDKYRNHRIRLAEDVRALHARELAEGKPDTLDTKIAALAEVFTRRHGYIGDDYRYNDLQNADLIRVIDRRLGLPVALSVLCIAIGRDIGWPVEGINFPAHFVVRMEQDGQRRIIDPFQGCIVLEARDLRDILKKTTGTGAELSAAYFTPTTNRGTLLRLENNIKFRQIEAEDYESALATVDLMRRFAPDEYRLDLDAGVLQARLNQPLLAIRSLERYISAVSNPHDRQDALRLLGEIKASLH